MKIYYRDEYGELLYLGYNKVAVPDIGYTVIINDENYQVVNVVWAVDTDDVEIGVTQNLVRPKLAENNSGRLEEVNRRIIDISKRQDSFDKKGTMLTEQVSTIRKHINQQIKTERKSNDTR